MKRIINLITAAFLLALIPSVIASGQEKKSEQKIKIVIADDGGSKVILDTLITGEPESDSIVLKNGHTIYLAHDDGDIAPAGHGTKKYIVTTTESNGGDKKQVNKNVTIISSDSDMGEGNSGKAYSYSSSSDNKDSERTKYVIDRDGVKITVEGTDYDKVKELTKEIEKTLDSKSPASK